MHFSTVLLFASTAVASNLAYRHEMPFMPRSLVARQNDACAGFAPEGMTCCGAAGGKFSFCNSTSTNSHCTNGDNMWWCCPEAEQNCPNPIAGSNDVCTTNNGGCGDGYNCSKDEGGCVPKPENNGGQGGTTPTNSGDQGGQSSPSGGEQNNTSSSGGAAPATAPSSGGESTNSSESSSSSSSASPSEATGAPSNTTLPAATAGASRVGGISALALAVMAGVLVL